MPPAWSCQERFVTEAVALALPLSRRFWRYSTSPRSDGGPGCRCTRSYLIHRLLPYLRPHSRPFTLDKPPEIARQSPAPGEKSAPGLLAAGLMGLGRKISDFLARPAVDAATAKSC